MAERSSKTLQWLLNLLRRVLCLFTLGVIVAREADLRAQEALRLSMAGAAAAEMRRLSLLTPHFYNLELGPTYWRVNLGVGGEYDDNVFLRATNRVGDWIGSTYGGVRMLWPITERNALNLSFEGGYRQYLEYNDLSRFFVRPGSEFSWDVYVGDFMFNIHDRLSITEAAYENPTVVGTGKYRLLDNASGIFVVGDLDKLVVCGGYDHVLYDTEGEALWVGSDANVDSWYCSAGLRLRPDMEVGLEGGFSLIQFEDPTIPDADQWHLGAYYNLIMGPNFKIQLHAGYTEYCPKKDQNFMVYSERNTVYTDIVLRHRVNRLLTYEATMGCVVNISFYGSTYETWFVHLRPRLGVIKNTAIATPISFEHGRWLYNVYGLGLEGETFDRIQVGVFITRKVAERVEGRVGWEYLSRSPETATWKYQVNRFTINLDYRF